MKVIETGIEGLKIIKLQQFTDNRGFFVERFNSTAFHENGLNSNIFQVNHSMSTKGVIRGMHFQTNPWQCKVVGCIGGSIIDVALDIRPNSPTFGKHFMLEISSPDVMLYVPHGFAHGFEVLSDVAHVLYFVDNKYDKSSDNGIHYNSCDINWQTKNPLISSKDKQLLTLETYINKIK